MKSSLRCIIKRMNAFGLAFLLVAAVTLRSETISQAAPQETQITAEGIFILSDALLNGSQWYKLFQAFTIDGINVSISIFVNAPVTTIQGFSFLMGSVNIPAIIPNFYPNNFVCGLPNIDDLCKECLRREVELCAERDKNLRVRAFFETVILCVTCLVGLSPTILGMLFCFTACVALTEAIKNDISTQLKQCIRSAPDTCSGILGRPCTFSNPLPF
jgi:hypothetical protein